MNILELAQNGLGAPAIAHYVLTTTMGAFFAASGFNKLHDRERHAGLVETLKSDHVPAVGFMQYWVPAWELAGGVALVLNVLPAFAATALLVICLVAACAEGARRVADFHPINRADRVADWLYLQEVLYIIALTAIILGV